ncbi:hypothetical protein [Desulfurobacterium indicum]|uniref:DUF2232 domain-containing protein n=1 Tax=Desulfurobacterium indicum TaxID=1914305 RepID=A0A1R1ML77_9BACT|nr:hypothetical protein [Desulfurobacterium indicum]OMH40561.1 hypothetical protein BLW93_04510 [Desulfurobacterium indicum]
MRNVKISLILFAIISLAGVAMGYGAFAAFGWGLSLFIPVTLFMGIEREGFAFSSMAILAGIGIVWIIGGWEVALNVIEMTIPGYITWFSLKKEIKRERLALLLTLYFYIISIAEDLFYGPPKDIDPIKAIIPFRWGLYFYTSALFAVIIMGTVALVAKKEVDFKKINFGATPVALFILSGIAAILKWFPVIQIVGANALIATCGFFLIQGFAVATAVIEKWQPLSRIITFFMAILFPLAALVIITLAGLFDFWFDFRKLKGGLQ